jgi:serine protease AprX
LTAEHPSQSEGTLQATLRFVRNFPTDDNPTILSVHQRTGARTDFTGRGVVMAFIDSGFYAHPDLGDRIVIHADATTAKVIEGGAPTRGRDYSWHGQMTSVIAAGDGRTSDGRYRGLAADARLVLIKVSNPRNRIKETDILRGLQWLAVNHARFGVRVVNISVGGDYESHDPDHPLHQSVQTLCDAGVIVVIAAGNQGRPALVPPASAPGALTIGGVDDRNTTNINHWRAYGNNYGVAYDGTAKPEIVGPAAWIASPILPGSPEAREVRWLDLLLDCPDEATAREQLIRAQSDLNLARWRAFNPDDETLRYLQARINKHKVIDVHHQHVDGTSVSSAIVASVVAQMLEANAQLTPSAVRAMLMDTAKLMPGVPPECQGAGIMDAHAAVSAALAAGHPQPTATEGESQS